MLIARGNYQLTDNNLNIVFQGVKNPTPPAKIGIELFHPNPSRGGAMKTKLLTLIITLAMLAGCTNAPTMVSESTVKNTPGIPQNPTTEPSSTSLQTNTPEPSPTSLLTNTPEPSPTARPHYEINNSQTWPQEMQDYYNRPIREWNDPLRTYMSDEAFHTQLIQMRRDFLTEQNISEAETMSENDLFTAYVRWGMEHKGEMLRLSPLEKSKLVSGPFMSSYLDGSTLYTGTQVSFDLGPAGVSQEAMNERQSDWYAGMNTHVFGNLVHFNRPAYAGIIGTLVGLVEPIGVSTDNAIECLMYYERDSQGYWALVNIPFTPMHYLAGDEFVALDGGYKTYTYAADNDGRAVRIGVSSVQPTLQDFVANIGRRIWLQDGGVSSVQSNEGPATRVQTELTVTGIESIRSVVFDIQQPDIVDLPWD